MKEIFLGKPLHWLLWVVILGVLFVLGRAHFHTNHFALYIFILVTLSAASVLVIMFTTRRGERITREPFDEE